MGLDIYQLTTLTAQIKKRRRQACRLTDRRQVRVVLVSCCLTSGCTRRNALLLKNCMQLWYRQCTYNVTMRRVHATIVAVRKQ